MNIRKNRIELLAPARDASVALSAIAHGADAVYMGAPQFGARAQAGNSVSDIGRVCDYAHQFQARVYATVNTIVYDDELPKVERLVHELYRAGVDAIIVQDMSLLRLDLPPVSLHASTQCDIRTPEKAKFLEQVGFAQLVLARELTLGEISAIRRVVNVPLEGFVHGALCVCYSGRCQASAAVKGRSANRGECAQLCRLPYMLETADGAPLMRESHFLSLRDFNASSRLEQMIDAGISSFKIEGRLKDETYVKNVVAYYRRALDEIIGRRPDELVRASVGESLIGFTPDLSKSFNRSFTTYFLDGHPLENGVKMASLVTPKSQGEPLGEVTFSKGRVLRVNTRQPLANGDGLSFVSSDGDYVGVRLNEVHGQDLLLNEPCTIPLGITIYRTRNQAFTAELSRHQTKREIGLNVALSYREGLLSLTLEDERGLQVKHSIAIVLEPAKQSQHDRQVTELSKLGDTIYSAREVNVLDGLFVPASVLSRLRRESVELLNRTARITYMREQRLPEDKAAKFFTDVLVSADNVANRLAEQFYRGHGVREITPALEVTASGAKHGQVVMQTRYCLRRELGCCLRDKKKAGNLPATLYLRNGSMRFAVQCDCTRCEMILRL